MSAFETYALACFALALVAPTLFCAVALLRVLLCLDYLVQVIRSPAWRDHGGRS